MNTRPRYRLRLNELLKERGWTAKQLSKATGISQPHISTLRRAQMTQINLSHAVRFKTAFGLETIDELIDTQRAPMS